jgi:hypothetical protein
MYEQHKKGDHQHARMIPKNRRLPDCRAQFGAKRP